MKDPNTVRQLRPLLLSVVTFLMVLAAGGAFINLAERRHADRHRHVVEEMGASHAHLLERQFARSLSSTLALAAILREYGEIKNFDALAAEMIKNYGGINNLQLAPNGVVTQIYPLAGNEEAIGHDLLNDPRRRTEAVKAIESRTLTLAGPFELIQGGMAVIGRLPVFIPNEAGGERFWGFTIALIHLNDLLEVGDLNRFVKRGYNYELSRIAPDSGQKTVFAGSIDTDLQDPISFEIGVPNGRWTLAVAPRGGWPSSSSLPVQVVLVLLVSSLVAALTYEVLRQPAILRRKVEVRTRELAETSRDLGNQITKRARAEEALREKGERLQRLLETTNAIPWEADAKTWQFIYVGPRAVTMLGYPLDRWYEKDFWVAHIYPEDRDFAIDFCQKSSETEDNYEFEYRMLSSNGETVWLQDIVNVIRENGRPSTLRGFMIDITERKRTEEALEQQRAFLRQVIDIDPNFIFAKDRDGRFTLVNQAVADAYGVTVEDLIGKTDADFNPNPEEVEFFRRMDLEVMDTLQERFIAEEVITDAKGKLRWLQTVKRPIVDQDGMANQILGSATDITERKRAEDALRKSEAAIQESRKALQELAGKLLTAQEAERRRLAREMHDDLTQRLAVLAIEAGKLETLLESSGGPVPDKLREMKEQMVKLAADVHAISRQLHPSILDDLGLVDAMESECTSFSQREGIVVKYQPKNVPAALPKDLALCLYRMTQEALRNIAKHAQTTEAHVFLTGKDAGIMLTIEDHGIGFDLAKVRGKKGLGLASMEERARLVQAELRVDSRPGKGTVIEVRAPMQRKKG